MIFIKISNNLQMKQCIFFFFIINVFLYACNDKSNKQSTNIADTTMDTNTDAKVIDSMHIFSVSENDPKSKNAAIIKIHLSEDVAIEDIVDEKLLSSEEEFKVIALDVNDIRKKMDVSTYDSLYFYEDLVEEGALKLLKKISLYITPMDTYLAAVYDNSSNTQYDFATNTKEISTKCLLTENPILPKEIKAIKPKNSDLKFFECNDRGYKMYSIIQDERSEMYFFKDDEKPVLVYQAKDTDMIFGIKPLPIFINSKPVLFAGIGEYEGDYVEEKLIVFDGNKYQFEKSGKVKITDVDK
jgi:hypothetical protein